MPTLPNANPPDRLSTPALRLTAGARTSTDDDVALEEPLELRLLRPTGQQSLTLLMRTPSAERELLTGWLTSEGLYPADAQLAPHPENPNVWYLTTAEHERLSMGARLHATSSACGVCGIGSIEQLTLRAQAPVWRGGLLRAEMLGTLPDTLQAAQPLFAATGGTHGAGLFTATGELLCAYEDVGRHNATDKVLGAAYLRGLDLSRAVLCVSSRAGFEIVQKALVSGVAVVVCVGAATSLAVSTAATFGLTLCAFTRQGRTTVYSGWERVAGARER